MASSSTRCVSERLLLLCSQPPSDSSTSDEVSRLLPLSDTFLKASVLLVRAPSPVSGDSRYSLCTSKHVLP